MHGRPIIDHPGALYGIIGESFRFFDAQSWFLAGWFFAITFWVLSMLPLYEANMPRSFVSRRIFGVLSSEIFFLVVGSLGLIFFRLPGILPFHLNPDESQAMVGAATLVHDARFWISVDGTTVGPLCYYPLCVLPLLGIPMGYATVRLFDIFVFNLMSVLLTYFSFRNFFGYRAARLCVFPLFLFLTFWGMWDLIAYNSERAPMLLTAISIFLVSCYEKIDKTKRRLAILAILGVVLGMFPYAKLQGVIIGLLIALFTGGHLVWHRHTGPRLFLLQATLFVAGGILPTVIVFTYLFVNGAIGDFWNSYILSNLIYTGRTGASFVQRLSFPYRIILYSLIVEMKYVYFFFLAVSIYSTSALLCRFISARKCIGSLIAPVTLGGCTMVGAYLGISIPGNGFPHYMVLSVIPFSFAALGIAAAAFTAPQFIDTRLSRLSLALIGVFFVFYIYPHIGNGTQWCLSSYKRQGNPPAYSAQIQAIRRYASPNDRMAMWGHMPHYYMFTGTIQGTREAHSGYQIIPSPLREYYIERYVRDMIEYSPRLFVDVVAPESFRYNDKRAFGFEQFDQVRELIETRYTQVAEVNGVKIYLLDGSSLNRLGRK